MHTVPFEFNDRQNHIHTYMHTLVYVYVYAYVYGLLCVFAKAAYTHTFIHSRHIYTCTHTHTHTCTGWCQRGLLLLRLVKVPPHLWQMCIHTQDMYVITSTHTCRKHMQHILTHTHTHTCAGWQRGSLLLRLVKVPPYFLNKPKYSRSCSRARARSRSHSPSPSPSPSPSRARPPSRARWFYSSYSEKHYLKNLVSGRRVTACSSCHGSSNSVTLW